VDFFKVTTGNGLALLCGHALSPVQVVYCQ
jgi:hypothetical protein